MTQPETARELLHRHGLPEDIIDGALCLHAQELAAQQRKAHDELRPYSHMGLPCKPEYECGARRVIDLIDPTREPAAVSAAVAPPTNQAAAEADADAVLAVLPPPADRASLATGLRAAADEIAGIDFHPNARARSLDIAAGLARRLRRMADETATAETQPLVHVGWWCWRGGNHGHLATMACRSDNVPIHVPAEWEDDMRALIQRLEDEDDEPAAGARQDGAES